MYCKRRRDTDLDAREDKLCLAICTSTQGVDEDHNDQAHGYPGGIVDCFVPIVDQNGGGREFSRKDLSSKGSGKAQAPMRARVNKEGPTHDDPIVVVVPAHGERESCSIDKFRS